MSSKNKKEELRANTQDNNKNTKTSKRISRSSNPLPIQGQSHHTNSDELNTSVEGSMLNRNIKKQYQSKLGTKKLQCTAKTELISQKKSKTNIKIDSKNISSIEINICNRREKNIQKKAKKSTHTFWESKLTGARRVSKRLTNLKLKNKTTTPKQEATSDKYFSKVVRPIKQTKVHKSITLSAFHNKFKIKRNTYKPKSGSGNNQSITPSPHGNLIDNNTILSNKICKESTLQSAENKPCLLRGLSKHGKPEHTSKNNLIPHGSNNHFDSCFTVSSNDVAKMKGFPADQVRKGDEVVDQGQVVVDHGQKVVDQGQEVVNQGQEVVDQGQEVVDQGQEVVDQGEGFPDHVAEGSVDQIVDVSFNCQESANLNESIEEDGVSVNETESIIKNITEMEHVNAKQNDNEAMDMEVSDMDIEADSISSNISQSHDSLVLSGENNKKQKKGIELVDDLKTRTYNSFDKKKINPSGSKNSQTSKNLVVVEEIPNNDSKAELDIT